MNQVSVYDNTLPEFTNQDPFEQFENPYKSAAIKDRIEQLTNDGKFDPESFFLITERSKTVG